MLLFLVEDNEGDAYLVEDLLGSAIAESPEVLRASSLAGLEALVAERGQPDVVLLDLGLPDSNGVATVVRAAAVCQGCAIIVLTGTDDKATALECIGVGAQDYIAKSMLTGAALRRAVLYGVGRLRERSFH